MKAFILAAGLGTRLKPWTLHHPKALVPIGGIPILERQIRRLEANGFDDITINVHHFATQIVDFIESKDWNVNINISDETNVLLDTGGGIAHAERYLCSDYEPILIHNVDILSNAPLQALMNKHKESGAEATLLTSDRASSRKLIFDKRLNLMAWQNLSTGQTKPQDYKRGSDDVEMSFSGIHVINPSLIQGMKEMGFEGKFSIIDFYLSACQNRQIKGYDCPTLKLLDIGKPETLSLAEEFFTEVYCN